MGRHGVYTPEKTKRFEAELSCLVAIKHKKIMSEHPLKVFLTFKFKRPKSVKRSHHTVKPDLDNLIKSVCDSLNGVVWKDDAQIMEITATKAYSQDCESDSIGLSVFEVTTHV